MDLEHTGDFKKEAPQLAAIGKTNPFTVPPQYFNDLHERLNTLVQLDLINDNTGFIVPDEYFNNLPALLEKRISLVADQKESEFSVPEGYFNSLPGRIQSNLPHKTDAKVIRLRTWMQYVAAACITIAVGTGVLLNTKQESTVQVVGLSAIPDEEIINYLQIHSDETDTPAILELLEGNSGSLPDISAELSDKELQQYITATER